MMDVVCGFSLQRLREQDGLAERKRIEQNQTLQLQREEVDRLRFLLFSKQEQFEEQLESHEQLAKQQQLKIEGLEADLAQARVQPSPAVADTASSCQQTEAL